MITILVLDAVTRAFGGYVNHAQIAPLLLLLLVALYWSTPFWSPLERQQLKVDSEKSTQHRTFVTLCALALVLPYTYIGLNRLLEGGIEVLTGHAVAVYMWHDSVRYSTYGFEVMPSLLDVPWVLATVKVGFGTTTCLEVCSGFVLFSRTFRLAWVGGMVAFHLMTIVCMNIFFWENLLLIIAVFGYGYRWSQTECSAIARMPAKDGT
jgi:hypothetical protein